MAVAPTTGRSAAGVGRTVRRLARIADDPARCFLAIGAMAGVLLALVIPPLAGTDEPAHFVRTYQVSTGRLVPLTPGGSEDGAWACVPAGLEDDLSELTGDYYQSLLDRAGIDPADAPRAQPLGTRSSRCRADERLVDLSAFGWYSPVSYAPGAIALRVADAFGFGARGLVLVVRLSGLAVYLALVYVAIRRSPFARWGLAAIGLLPVALFQAASSRSPDTVTIGVAMLVLVSALRVVHAGADRDAGSPLAERVGLGVLLGVLKPTYAVIALCYLLPLAGRNHRERLLRTLAPVATAFAASALWQRYSSKFFICDARYFGIHPRPGEQISTILHSPHRYAWGILGSFVDYGGKWLDQTATVGVTVANWAWPGVALALVAMAVAAARRDRREVLTLAWSQRALLIGVALAGAVLVISGQHVYCSNVGLSITYPPHARHFLPVLPLLVVALTPNGHPAPTTRIPAAALLATVSAAFVVGTALEMR